MLDPTIHTTVGFHREDAKNAKSAAKKNPRYFLCVVFAIFAFLAVQKKVHRLTRSENSAGSGTLLLGGGRQCIVHCSW